MRIPITFNRGGYPGRHGDEEGLLIAVTGDTCHVVNVSGEISILRTYNVRVKMGQPFTRSITAAVKP